MVRVELLVAEITDNLLCTFCSYSTLDVPFGTGSHKKGGAKGHPVEGNHPFLLETVRKSDR